MKAALLLPFFLFASTVSAQQYEIPGAEQQPAWVFPLYFEDGFGFRDTVYLGYDDDARGENYGPTENPIWNPDTVFNEVFDTLTQDSVFHVNTRPENDFPHHITVSVNQYATGYFIMCNHAKLPLKIKWDGSLLYSTDLPFPDQLPLPTVEGIFWVSDLSECGGTEPIIISDTTDYYPPECTFADSVVLDLWNCPGCMTNTLLYLDFESWDGGWTSVEEPGSYTVRAYPNPFGPQLRIQLPTNTDRISIRDITGRVVFEQYRNLNARQLVLDTNGWPPGMYTANISTNNQSTSTKLIKIN